MIQEIFYVKIYIKQKPISIGMYHTLDEAKTVGKQVHDKLEHKMTPCNVNIYKIPIGEQVNDDHWNIIKMKYLVFTTQMHKF